MQNVARFLTWLGNKMLDAALRIEARDWPPAADFPRIDTSKAPFLLPPDIEPTNH